jgi:hypothetical protein
VAAAGGAGKPNSSTLTPHLFRDGPRLSQRLGLFRESLSPFFLRALHTAPTTFSRGDDGILRNIQDTFDGFVRFTRYSGIRLAIGDTT